MKKLMWKLNFAIVGVMASVSAFAAAATSSGDLLANAESMLCQLADQFNGVFKLFRALAFIGAGLMLATWGYTLLTKGEGFDQEAARKKLTSILAGTIILFSIGVLLDVFMRMASNGGSLGCVGTMFS